MNIKQLNRQELKEIRRKVINKKQTFVARDLKAVEGLHFNFTRRKMVTD